MLEFRAGDHARLVNEGKTDNGEHPSWANKRYIEAGVYAGEFEIVYDHGPKCIDRRYTLYSTTSLPDIGAVFIFRDGCDLIPASAYFTEWQTRRLTVVVAR